MATEIRAEDRPGYETFAGLVKWMQIAKENGEEFYAKGNQSAARRSRKAFDQIARLKVQWRKELMAEGR